MHTHTADPHVFSDLVGGESLFPESSYLIPVDRRSASLVDPPSLGLGDSFSLPLTDDISLELSESRKRRLDPTLLLMASAAR